MSNFSERPELRLLCPKHRVVEKVVGRSGSDYVLVCDIVRPSLLPLNVGKLSFEYVLKNPTKSLELFPRVK